MMKIFLFMLLLTTCSAFYIYDPNNTGNDYNEVYDYYTWEYYPHSEHHPVTDEGFYQIPVTKSEPLDPEDIFTVTDVPFDTPTKYKGGWRGMDTHMGLEWNETM